MSYSIKEVSQKTGLSIHTIRYYDQEGLLPRLKRSSGGRRIFSDHDIAWLELICCLKNHGMPLETVKKFMTYCLQGAKTCEQRKEILEAHRTQIEEQIKQLCCHLEMINYKLEHYQEIGIFHLNDS